MRQREAPVVVICGDVGTEPVPIRPGELVARLRRELSGATAPLVLAEICGASEALVEAVATTESRRVVVGCRAASHRRGELLARLRRAGVPTGGIALVDLQTAEGCSAPVALEQSVALLSAAVARVAGADVEVPVRERTSLSVGGVSRRSLLRGVNTARRFLAVWRPDRCSGAMACTPCALACPHGALHRSAGRMVVDPGRCNGCGVCVAACRSGAFALPGAEIEGISAAAAVLVASMRRCRSVTGVAIVCQHSKWAPRVGEPWLALCVPSIEMVTAGWLLQLIRAGVGVRVVACEDEHCEKRVAELEHFVRDLSVVLGFSAAQELEATDRDGVYPIAEPAVADFAASGDRIELREPEATNEPLAAFGALGPGRDPWRVEGPGCSLGVVSIDAGGCSLCEVCVGVCVTGALRSEPNSAGLCLSIDSGSCTACGACVASCPEKVVTVTRAVDGALLAGGRRIVATGSAVECATCGAPLVAVLSQNALRLRLGGSPSALTAGTISVCADCRLGGRTVTASRRLAT